MMTDANIITGISIKIIFGWLGRAQKPKSTKQAMPTHSKISEMVNKR